MLTDTDRHWALAPDRDPGSRVSVTSLTEARPGAGPRLHAARESCTIRASSPQIGTEIVLCM
jgi:hypothetical protein